MNEKDKKQYSDIFKICWKLFKENEYLNFAARMIYSMARFRGDISAGERAKYADVFTDCWEFFKANDRIENNDDADEKWQKLIADADALAKKDVETGAPKEKIKRQFIGNILAEIETRSRQEV